MTFWKVLAAILLILFLLGLIRVGGVAEYADEGVHVWIKVGAVPIRVFPVKEKKGKKKDKSPPEKRKKKPEKGKKGTGGSFVLLKRMLPLVGEAAGALKRRIRIDELDIDFTAGGVDPARTAMIYGYSNMAAGMILPVFVQNFDVRDYHIHTGVDFLIREPRVYLKAAFSARMGQLVSFAVIFGVKFFRAYLDSQKAAKTQKG